MGALFSVGNLLEGVRQLFMKIMTLNLYKHTLPSNTLPTQVSSVLDHGS